MGTSRVDAGRAVCPAAAVEPLLAQAVGSAVGGGAIAVGVCDGGRAYEFLAVCYSVPLFVVFGQVDSECFGGGVGTCAVVLLEIEEGELLVGAVFVGEGRFGGPSG